MRKFAQVLACSLVLMSAGRVNAQTLDAELASVRQDLNAGRLSLLQSCSALPRSAEHSACISVFGTASEAAYAVSTLEDMLLIRLGYIPAPRQAEFTRDFITQRINTSKLLSSLWQQTISGALTRIEDNGVRNLASTVQAALTRFDGLADRLR